MPQISNEGPDNPLVFEQLRNFGGGEDSFRDPIELEPDQCQKLVNILIRDKLKAITRPGADGLGFNVTDGTGGKPGAASAIKGLFYYSTPTITAQVLANVGDNLYAWTGSAWGAAIAGWTTNSSSTFLEIAQGVDLLLLSDGISNLRKYDGTTFTDLGNAGSGPPVGTSVLCWHTGRMFAAGISAYPDTVYVSNRLAFDATDWNATTRSFRVGAGDGDNIVSMVSLPGFVLGVLKQNSVWLVLTDPLNEPSNFSTLQSTELLCDGIGCVGRKSAVRYGNDLLFMAQDGVRSLRRMVSAASQFELSAPISEPVQPTIDRINWNYGHLITGTKYKEFVLWALPLDASAYCNGVLVWNGRLGRWLGLWDTWTAACFAVSRYDGVQRLLFGDHAGYVNQWKDFADDEADATYLDNLVGYATKLWTRSMTFGDIDADKSGFNLKARFNKGRGTVNISAVGDEIGLRTTSAENQAEGDILGQDTLPFQLATNRPIAVRGSLRGLNDFQELYLKIETGATDGSWFELRNASVSARVRPIKNK